MPDCGSACAWLKAAVAAINTKMRMSNIIFYLDLCPKKEKVKEKKKEKKPDEKITSLLVKGLRMSCLQIEDVLTMMGKNFNPHS